MFLTRQQLAIAVGIGPMRLSQYFSDDLEKAGLTITRNRSGGKRKYRAYKIEAIDWLIDHPRLHPRSSWDKASQVEPARFKCKSEDAIQSA